MLLERFEGNPILAPDPSNEWEALVRTNPGACYDDETGTVKMLYRAAGNDPEHRIYLGLATSQDGYNFTPVSDKPSFGPSEAGFDAGCVEDPRIIKIGEWYYITYACRALPPGQYWLPRDQQIQHPRYPAAFPLSIRENLMGTGLAITKNFRDYIRAGRITSPVLSDHDVFFFPEQVNGKWILIHRPMSWYGEQYGTAAPAIWINRSTDMMTWDFTQSTLLAKGESEWEYGKIGGNAPPVKTDEGWLLFYHAIGPDGYYRIGCMLLDLDNPFRVTHRTPEPLYEPEEDYEKEGFYGGGGVVFSCANILIGDTLFVYYGGADRYVCLATCKLRNLIDYLLSHPV